MDHAAALMRHVYEHCDEVREVGGQARRDVEREIDRVRVGRLIRERLDAVAALAAR